MNNLNGNRKNEFRRKQEEKQRKLALKIEDEAGELREGSLKSEEAIPSLDELCAMGERVEQQTTFSAKEAIRNKIKARRDAERYKTTSTDSEKWTPNPFEDSNAAAIESPKNEDTLNTTRKHADAQSTKSAGLKTSKRRSIVEMVQKLKKYVPMETHYDDTLLGSLQKELDSFNTSKAIEWLAYDVDYLMGEAYPGETAYVLITEDEYTFSKQGAYKLTYVDTGKTTELVDDQGFRWEASVYFVVDEDTYNENLQKMFRAEQALYDTYERILNNFGLAE